MQNVRSGRRVQVGATKDSRRFASPLDHAQGYEVNWSVVSPLFQAARRFDNPCFVYLIGEEDEGAIKIGVAKDPIKRLRTMQTGNPRRLRVEVALLAEMPTEKLLHELWEPFAVASASSRNRPAAAPRTEWFAAEIRPKLFPIAMDAAAKQVSYLQGPGDKSYGDLDQIVRDSHKRFDYVVQGRDDVLLLNRGGGISRSRLTRI